MIYLLLACWLFTALFLLRRLNQTGSKNGDKTARNVIFATCQVSQNDPQSGMNSQKAIEWLDLSFDIKSTAITVAVTSVINPIVKLYHNGGLIYGS